MILFRCDAGPNLGFGHLMRCRTLAEELSRQGEEVAIIGPIAEYQTSKDMDLFSVWVPKPHWGSETEDANFVLAQAEKYNARALVLDDYRVNEEYQKILRNNRLPWLQFDGKADRPLWADIILNASPAAAGLHYDDAVKNKNTKLLLGPQYGIVRAMFSSQNTPLVRPDVSTILVTFGGGDDRGAILMTLDRLLPIISSGVRIVVISGKSNPRNAEIRRWIIDNAVECVTLRIDPDDVASVYRQCDMAVMSGGTSTFEAASCGLPMVLLTIADNQVEQASAWATLGVALYAGSIDSEPGRGLTDAVARLLDAPITRTQMAQSARSLVDGLGSSRVASELLQVNS